MYPSKAKPCRCLPTRTCPRLHRGIPAHAPAATQLTLLGGTVLLLLEPEPESGATSTSLVLAVAAAVPLKPRSSWYCGRVGGRTGAGGREARVTS